MSQGSFRINDVLAVAEALEESAAEVYRAAAEDAGSARLRETLIGLAEMEEDHRTTFAELRSSLPSRGGGDEPDEELVNLFATWLDDQVFTPVQSIAEHEVEDNDILSWLHTSIGMEKESIAFYSGIREMVVAEEQPVIDSIIEEELRHLVTLSGLLRQLSLGA
jgi:rubrerythrin